MNEIMFSKKDNNNMALPSLRINTDLRAMESFRQKWKHPVGVVRDNFAAVMLAA